MASRRSRILMRLRRILRNDQLVLGLLAVLVGAGAAGGIILFREGIGLFQSIFYGTADERLASWASGLPWWQVLLAPAAGGLVVGLFFRFLMPGGGPQAVAHVIEASAMKGARMPLRAGIGAALASALSIGAGASVGREGPAVHLGATLGAWIAARMRLGRTLSRTLLGCGVAAAVAASFNAPIAGALFASEVVVGHYALSAFGPIVVASVTGTIVSRVWFGDFPAFVIPESALASFLEFPAFAGLGVVAALVALAFMRSILLVEERAGMLPLPNWARPALGGLAVGAIAVAFPQVLGVGYEVTDEALRGAVPFVLLVALVVAKVAATALSLGSGFGGGVFSPAITIGALLGGAYGMVATAVFPDLSSGPAAYALVGMGAVAAAVLGAPISTTLIIFELTGDYTLTVAVMLAVVISTVLTQQIGARPSFFHWQLERRGLNLGGNREAALLRAIRVAEVMAPAPLPVPAAMGLREVRARLQGVPYGELFVVDAAGRLFGTITLRDLADAAFDSGLDDLVNAQDAARQRPPVLEPKDDLAVAMRLMHDTAEEHIAVIDSRDGMRLVGCLHEKDVLLAYSRALAAARAEERGEGRRAPPAF